MIQNVHAVTEIKSKEWYLGNDFALQGYTGPWSTWANEMLQKYGCCIVTDHRGVTFTVICSWNPQNFTAFREGVALI